MKFSPLRFFTSLLIGAILALAFASPYLTAEKYSALDKLALTLIPAFSVTFILYALFPYLEEKLRAFPLRKISTRLWNAWLIVTFISFIGVGFLETFYPEAYQIILLTLLSQLTFGAFSYHLIGRARSFFQRSKADFAITLFLFIALVSFIAATFRMNAQFPVLFKTDVFLLESRHLILFFAVSILSIPFLAWVISQLQIPRINNLLIQNKFTAFIRENLSGILLFFLFFYLYLLNGSVLNFPRFDVDDIFFDSDGFIWRFRLTTEHWQDFYWRSVHPLALLILKSLVNFLALFLNGNLEFAAIILTALAGAACVLLAWMFMKGVLQDSTSALVMAALLGLSATQLFFGSLIETYIFLAAVTLFAFVLAQRKNLSFPLWVTIGVVTMGITLTNFAQTVIALFCSKPNIKSIIRYGVIVVSLVVSLTLVSNMFYPNASPYFFVPSTFLAEEQNIRAVSLNRAAALTRAFVFNNIAAPEPMTFHKDIPFTQFRFYRAEDYTISRYATPLQKTTEWIWIALLLLAAIFFFKDIKSHPLGITLALIGCVSFNLLIHLRYGKELFLYSPNWTYAVVLLLGISWKGLLKRRWFQLALMSFLILLMWNNSALFRTIMDISSPYIAP